MGDLSWSQAATGGIELNEASNIWNSGHVNAVLPMSTGLLVASDTGGLWTATESGPALQISDWDAPDLTSLARGPDGENHVFVGGGLGISLTAPEVVLTSPDQLHAFAVGQDHALWHYTRDAGSWSAPESLGIDVVGPPAVCSWGPDRVDVFVVGTDSALWHKWWDGSTWGPSQTGYEPLGGACVGQPCAVASAPNRLDVFVVGTDGTLNHKSWNGTSWSGYESLGGSLIPSPVAISTGAGRLDVFCARRGDHMLLHKRYDGSWLPSPTDYEELGPIANVPAATSWGSNTIQLCAVQPDGSLGYKSWDGASWAPATTGWTSLGALPDRFITAPSVASWGPDRLDMVCVDATGTLQHKWLDGTTWGPSATAWEAMGTWVAGHANLVAPAANRLDIVINGGDGLLYWKSYDGAGWVPWLTGWNSLTRPLIGALHESDVNALAPLLSWREVATPHEAGRVAAILVLPAIRRILLGCDNGLWWSDIPGSSAGGAGYAWSRVDALPSDCGFSGLAATGDRTFVVAAYGSNVGTGGYGLFQGEFGPFGPPGPTVQRSTIIGADPRLMARTSVATCDNARTNVYAVACDVWGDHAYTETPDAVCWGPNRIDLFARGGTSDCQHLSWNGSTWIWDSLGGVMLGTPRAVSWGLGRLDVFCIGTDRALYHKWFDGTAWGPSHTDWERMGGVFVSDPTVCAWGPNRLDVFGVGLDGALYHQWWDGAGWGPSPTSFENLGGGLWGQPFAVASAANRLDVYGIDRDGKLTLRRYDGTSWQAWRTLGDEQVFYPTAVANSGGAVEVFCVGAGGNVLHKRWDGLRWLPSDTTYEDLGGVVWDAPSAVVNGGTIEVYVRGTDNIVYVNVLLAGGAWSGWTGLGGSALGSPAMALVSGPRAVSWGHGRRDVFVKVPTPSPPAPPPGDPGIWDLWSDTGVRTWASLGGDLRPAVAPDSIYTFLRSTDSGATFVSGAMYLPDSPNHIMMDIAGGNQGWYNNCVTVRPTDAGSVVVGWRGGPYLSTDAGDTWRRIDDGDGAGNCHGDVHTVQFDGAGTDLFSGSDGGVAVTSDLGGTWRSGHNRLLHTLQVYGGGIVAFSSSYQVDGLVVAGLQDNGNISCLAGRGEPWRQFINSDGGITVCLRTGQILYTNNMDSRVSVFRYGGSGAKVPLTVPKPGGSASADGLACNPHIVNEPTYRNAAGEWIMAVASDGTDLYGGFAHSDGSDLHWEYLGTISVSNGATITCANSGNGTVILAGFSDGRIAAFDTATGSSTFQTIYPGKDGPGSVVRVLMHDTTYAYAIANRGPNGIVLRYLDGVWERVARNLPLEAFAGLTTDWLADPKVMFVSTDSRVYRSTDRGESWQIEVQGLPRRAHVGELDFVSESTGARFIHAASWGHSIFRSAVTY